jgi:endonuclease/exonuclease/phosphatase family metal-dependent hydrolase
MWPPLNSNFTSSPAIGQATSLLIQYYKKSYLSLLRLHSFYHVHCVNTGTVDRIHKNRKKLIICGDWNINLLQVNEQALALENILVSYDLKNTVTVPTRVTSLSKSLIDVMITNKHFNKNYTEIVNMGFSDHLAQILWVNIDT